MPPTRLIQKVVHYIFDNKSDGDLLMDVSPKWSWDELKELAQNRIGWRQRVRAIKSGTRVAVDISSADTPIITATTSLRDSQPLDRARHQHVK